MKAETPQPANFNKQDISKQKKKPHKARTDKPPNKTPSSTNFESQHSTMANDVTKASK
jgi:hypothetical protein